MKIPCPDPNLPAGLTQRDIDRAYDGYGNLYPIGDAEKYERELEKADRWRDEEKDRRAERDSP